MKQRLDQAMMARGIVISRSQGESWIRLGKVFVDGKAQTKPGFMVADEAVVELRASEQYVSRAGLKLASVAKALYLDFADKVMLDVGSSTGGFTDYALQHGARKVIAIELGTNQLHPSLLGHEKIELHEQTDIRDVVLDRTLLAGGGPVSLSAPKKAVSRLRAGTSFLGAAPQAATPDAHHKVPVLLAEIPDIIVIDVSFVSLRDILPHIAKLSSKDTRIIAMVKPQFEARASNLRHKGVIKNDRMRRDILKDFEDWARLHFVILDKADSEIAGAKGNLERFYKLKKV